jgi:squalene-hopene/tetraprenyl-beta-curcumene cyclase
MQTESPAKVTPLRGVENLALRVSHSISRAKNLILSQQYEEGFWWYTLEANESISAEFIMLLNYLGLSEKYSNIQASLVTRILSQQRNDGSWALYHDGPGDLSTTVECYFALKLAQADIHSEPLQKARSFILHHGGLTQTRIFTKIHLALFGLIPWKASPAMPVSFMLFPEWFSFTIYEFSSWARACIVPLLVVLEKKKTVKIPLFNLDELYTEPANKRDFSLKTTKGFLSWENLFVQADRILKISKYFIWFNPLKKSALRKAEQWIRTHIEKTEDIYPALAYSIFALKALGHPLEDGSIQKCFNALLSFQQRCKDHLPELPTPAHSLNNKPPRSFEISETQVKHLHQQCCISPVWDTPWAGMALIESKLEPDHPSLLKTARWLISKQITHTHGDWSVKNKKGIPGGWSFEFENEFFPDVDDTIEVLSFLFRVDLPREEMASPFQRGLDWLFSMQSKNGGWAAFDVNNTAAWVNKIPFSDHGACLDPPSPDITGRMLELLGFIGYSKDHPVCEKALHFIKKTQEPNGSWWGRWGVNYIYGTWCVLQGLASMGISTKDPSIHRSVEWLKSIQNSDGGWSESCDSYLKSHHIPLKRSTASQTAWALMGLIAAGERNSKEVRQGIEFLLSEQNSHGVWNEEAYTGTGFPGHFYIRYHGYRHYFPLLALAKYRNSLHRENNPTDQD